MSTPRFNLRNASLFLSKLKNKYNNQTRLSEQNRDNTFIDEEDQFTSSNPSMRKKSSLKIDSASGRFMIGNQYDDEIKGQQQSLGDKVSKEERMQEEVNLKQPILKQKTISHQSNSLPEQRQQQTQFCDLIVIKHLEQTLNIYKSDLSILQHNQQNLQQQIYFLGKKIGKLHQLSAENIKLQKQIHQLNQELKEIIEEYHWTNRVVWKKRVQMASRFRKMQNKLKSSLLISKHHELNDIQLFLTPNCHAQGYSDQYMAFLDFKKQQHQQVSLRLMQEKQNHNELSKDNQKFIKKLFQDKEKIYLRQQAQLETKPSNQHEPKLIPPPNLKEKEKNVVLYDESEKEGSMEEDKPKDKTKKLSESERAALLGDLKSFSKSFKIPNK